MCTTYAACNAHMHMTTITTTNWVRKCEKKTGFQQSMAVVPTMSDKLGQRTMIWEIFRIAVEL